MSQAVRVSSSLPAQANIKLVVQKGPHQGQRYSFVKDKITMGRSPENDIVLINDPLVSRQHACIQIVNNEVEIINLSQKNHVLVNGETVQKWKLTNDTTFSLGDTEFLIQIDLGQSVVAVKPVVAASATTAKPKPAGNKAPVAKSAVVKSVAGAPAVKPSAMPMGGTHPQQQNMQQMRPQSAQAAYAASMAAASKNATSGGGLTLENPRVRFYAIILVVVVAFAYFMMSGTAKKTDKKSTMQYSDVTAMKMNTQEEKDLQIKRENIAQQRQTASYVRVEENVKRGMREFQLGNFARSQEYFQLVLRDQSGHPIAQRYLYLSKVRFDEVVKEKINLGQMYYSANNFKLCASLFQQVKDMLQGRDNDTNLQVADQMLKKCNDAIEGIR